MGRPKKSESTNTSYREPSDSDESEREVEKEKVVKDQDFSDEEPSPSEASGTDYEGESSGSEYGGKNKKTLAKAVGKGKGRGKGGKKAAATPKGGRGRGRPAAPAKNGSKKSPVKRGREDSEDSMSESASSGSEYGKKTTPSPKKRVAPAKKTPTAAPKKAASPVKSSRARRGRPAAKAKSYKEVCEDQELELEVSEDEKKPVSKRAKLEPKKKKVSEDEEDMSVSEEDEAPEKGNIAKNNGNGTTEKKKVEKDSEPEEEEKKSDKSDISDEESEEEPKAKEMSPALDEEDEKTSSQKQLKSRTDTDYSNINFECDKKTSEGDAWNLKIACWNIGGSNGWIKKNGLEYLKKEVPDIMCLVEVKCNEKTKPEELKTVDGYPHIYWSCNTENSGQSGVAILTKKVAKSVEYGLSIGDSDSDEDKKTKESLNREGRLITLEYENYYLINAYVPNSGRPEKSDDFPKGYPPKVVSGERQKFNEFFRSHVKELEKTKPVIVTGDLNVSHQEIDLANPNTKDKSAGFTKEEREGMTQLLDETTLVDSFRTLYPDKKDTYTFWSYMHNSRQKNIGWRLDYFLVSKNLQDSVCENLMRTEVFGSDHCPIVLFIKN